MKAVKDAGKKAAKSAAKGAKSAAKGAAKGSAKAAVKGVDKGLRYTSDTYDQLREDGDNIRDAYKKFNKATDLAEKTINGIINAPKNLRKAFSSGKAVMAAGKSALTWLATPPWGWVVSAILIFVSIGLFDGSSNDTHTINQNDQTEVVETTGGSGGLSVNTVSNQRKRAVLDDCGAARQKAEDASGPKLGSKITDAQTKENAKKVYSVLSEWGLSDVQVAGVLGNWAVESGIQSRKFESDYTGAVKSNAYDIADKKGATAENLFNGGWGAFVAAYGNISLNDGTYNYKGDGNHWIGVGLGQWTGIGADNLWQFSKELKKSQFDIDTQLAFMISNVEGSFYDRLEKYRDMKASTAADAANQFMQYWEVNVAGLGSSERLSEAGRWLVEIKKMDKDSKYAKSILSNAKSSIAKSNSKAAKEQNAKTKCGESSSGGSIDSGYLMKVPYGVAYGFGTYYPGGPVHHGVDIHSSEGEGTDMYSAAAGEVVVADGSTDPMGAWMTIIKLDSGDGYLTYAHLVAGSNKDLKVGQHIDKGDYVGKLGSTGNSTAAHLHLQYDRKMTWGKDAENPWEYIKGVEKADDIDGTKHTLDPDKYWIYPDESQPHGHKK